MIGYTKKVKYRWQVSSACLKPQAVCKVRMMEEMALIILLSNYDYRQ